MAIAVAAVPRSARIRSRPSLLLQLLRLRLHSPPWLGAARLRVASVTAAVPPLKFLRRSDSFRFVSFLFARVQCTLVASVPAGVLCRLRRCAFLDPFSVPCSCPPLVLLRAALPAYPRTPVHQLFSLARLSHLPLHYVSLLCGPVGFSSFLVWFDLMCLFLVVVHPHCLCLNVRLVRCACGVCRVPCLSALRPRSRPSTLR